MPAAGYTRTIAAPGPERGMVFQDYGLFPWLTVKQNVGFGQRQRQRNVPKARLDELSMHDTEMVGLGKFADYYPGQLSGGMKQRVAIARVLANECEVPLMDEAIGALDAPTREKLQHELLDIWQRTKLTVVFLIHAVEEAVLLSDRVAVMTAGPGRIDADIRLDLLRPREITTPTFSIARRDLTLRLTSHLRTKETA